MSTLATRSRPVAAARRGPRPRAGRVCQAARGAVGRRRARRGARRRRRRPAGASTPGSSRASCSASGSATSIDMSADHGRWPFFDKDTLPLKRLEPGGGVRIVPGRIDRPRRRLSRRAASICMPPMYINIGAYVGDETLIDSHALVGSCAQIGRARAPQRRGADWRRARAGRRAAGRSSKTTCSIGGNCGVYEGAIVKRRAVLASGTILTGSTPIYDLPNDRIIDPAAGAAAGRSRRARSSCPGARR